MSDEDLLYIDSLLLRIIEHHFNYGTVSPLEKIEKILFNLIGNDADKSIIIKKFIMMSNRIIIRSKQCIKTRCIYECFCCENHVLDQIIDITKYLLTLCKYKNFPNEEFNNVLIKLNDIICLIICEYDRYNKLLKSIYKNTYFESVIFTEEEFNYYKNKVLNKMEAKNINIHYCQIYFSIISKLLDNIKYPFLDLLTVNKLQNLSYPH